MHMLIFSAKKKRQNRNPKMKNLMMKMGKSESLQSFCDEVRWLVSPLHGMMHISQSMELRNNSPLPVATGPKCQIWLRFWDCLSNTGKQLCNPCSHYETYANNWISLGTKYLPKIIEEDSNRKPITWTFYCGRISGLMDPPMDEDHFIKFKESFLNSVRWVTVIPTLLLINSYINWLTLLLVILGHLVEPIELDIP
jgi:hypothetical protein